MPRQHDIVRRYAGRLYAAGGPVAFMAGVSAVELNHLASLRCLARQSIAAKR